MGDRALVQFTNNSGSLSPTTYLHWDGDAVPSLLVEHRRLMSDRYNDLSYSAARFIGLCHARNADSNLSLGCWNSEEELDREDSHGDAGCFVVNVDTGEIKTGGGYGFVVDRENFLTTSEWDSDVQASATISEEGIRVERGDTEYLITQDEVLVLSEV